MTIWGSLLVRSGSYPRDPELKKKKNRKEEAETAEPPWGGDQGLDMKLI